MPSITRIAGSNRQRSGNARVGMDCRLNIYNAPLARGSAQ
jgi:hypothetical protein